LSSESIGLQQIRNIPTLTDMLQFLAHAMRVGGAKQTSADLEDLLRTSLVYRQASDEPERAAALAKLCRQYLQQVSGQPGFAALSDQTGFSTPTVGMLIASRGDHPSLSDAATWQAAKLFGTEKDPLVDRMRILGEVPELDLGWEAVGTFSPERAADIVTDWVNGMPLSDLANRYGNSDLTDEQRVAEFAQYLYGTLSYKASWGLGALQSVCLADDSTVEDNNDSRYVPAMVYFGVKTQQAVWMRMAGLPRVAAAGVGQMWTDGGGDVPVNYQQIRDFLSGLNSTQWEQSVPPGPLTGAEMRLLWREALG